MNIEFKGTFDTESWCNAVKQESDKIAAESKKHGQLQEHRIIKSCTPVLLFEIK